MENTFFMISIAVLLIGMLCISVGGAIFKFRAFTNKQAWNGRTKPFLYTGIILFIIGLVLVYVTYPFQ